MLSPNTIKKDVVCIHHNDMDGFTSAAIVKYWLKSKPIKFIEFSYGQKDAIDINEYLDKQIIIVDVTLDPEQMKKLLKESQIQSELTIITHQ